MTPSSPKRGWARSYHKSRPYGWYSLFNNPTYSVIESKTWLTTERIPTEPLDRKESMNAAVTPLAGDMSSIGALSNVGIVMLTWRLWTEITTTIEVQAQGQVIRKSLGLFQSNTIWFETQRKNQSGLIPPLCLLLNRCKKSHHSIPPLFLGCFQLEI